MKSYDVKLIDVHFFPAKLSPILLKFTSMTTNSLIYAIFPKVLSHFLMILYLLINVNFHDYLLLIKTLTLGLLIFSFIIIFISRDTFLSKLIVMGQFLCSLDLGFMSSIFCTGYFLLSLLFCVKLIFSDMYQLLDVNDLEINLD